MTVESSPANNVDMEISEISWTIEKKSKKKWKLKDDKFVVSFRDYFLMLIRDNRRRWNEAWIAKIEIALLPIGGSHRGCFELWSVMNNEHVFTFHRAHISNLSLFKINRFVTYLACRMLTRLLLWLFRLDLIATSNNNFYARSESSRVEKKKMKN